MDQSLDKVRLDHDLILLRLWFLALAIRRAVVLLSSQKAMVVALAVLNELTPFLGTEVVGVACIPCILVNFSQTIIGSILASFWAKSQGEDGGLETILIIKQ